MFVLPGKPNNLTRCFLKIKPNLLALVTTRYKNNIMKYLNVAEKNDAAKNIAAHLSRGSARRREGYSQYNKIYEFETDAMGQKSQMVMTSVSGHLLQLGFVGTYKNWLSCTPLMLFDAPVFKYCPENYEKIKKTLEREITSCQGLIIWTDCDREGENIGFEIIQVCRAVKSKIPVYRAKFSEITSVSVRRALQNLEQPNKNISDAVDVRTELDLRIGAAFTRFQTLRLQKVFPSKLADSLVSYGSCQFPTLGFVVERYRAVENFVSEPFWKIKVNHTKNGLSVDFAWERIRLFDYEACQVFHDICSENSLAKVCDVKTKPKSKWRPLPLDTVELEKSASRKLRINAKETMRLAEKLYTQGFISYPRTETNEFPKEMNLGQLVGLQTGDANWGQFAQGILDSGGPTPRQGNKSDKAHPPIHPTKYTNSLTGNEQRLYEFIVRSFLACCSKDAQGQETTVTIDIANEKFSASGLMITARNYLDVYPYDKWSSKEIHVYQTDETFTPTSIDLVDGNTSPPNLLTEADLIALMEKHGIGTDATHAEHIEKIKSRSYVALADAIHFVPGLLGMGLVEGYDAMGLNMSKPYLRAQLEADLKAISEGRKQPQVVLAEQIAKYKEVYLTVTAEAEKIDSALGLRFSERPSQIPATEETATMDMTPALKCPNCGSDMVVRRKKNNVEELYIGCMSFPDCKNAVWFPSIVKTLEVLSDTCATCGPNYKKLKFEWRNHSIDHLYPPPYTTCIGGCDSSLLEDLQINAACVKAPNNRPARPVTSASSNNNPQTNRTNSQTDRMNPQTNSNSNPQTNRNNPQTNRSNPRNNNSTVSVTPAPTIRPFNPPNQQQRAPTNTIPRMPLPRSSNDSDDNNVLCNCHKPAILLTVRKQNENCGKKFYKCMENKDRGGCDFFLWAPETMDTNQNPYDTPPTTNSWGLGASNSSRQSQSNAGNTSRGWGITPSFSRDNFPANDDGVTCDCGLPSKKVTVQKEGPNKGRQFYGCPKDMNARCKFFQWADDGATNTDWGSSSSAYSGNRGRGRGRGARGARGGGARKCTKCRQEGHTRSRCPENED